MEISRTFFSDLISDYLSPVVEATANQSISGDEWQTSRCFFQTVTYDFGFHNIHVRIKSKFLSIESG